MAATCGGKFLRRRGTFPLPPPLLCVFAVAAQCSLFAAEKVPAASYLKCCGGSAVSAATALQMCRQRPPGRVRSFGRRRSRWRSRQRRTAVACLGVCVGACMRVCASGRVCVCAGGQASVRGGRRALELGRFPALCVRVCVCVCARARAPLMHRCRAQAGSALPPLRRRTGRVNAVGLAGGAPAPGYDPTTPAGSSKLRRTRSYARRRRHSLAHLYAVRSSQYGSWDGVWVGHVPSGHVPRRPGRLAVWPIGDRLGRVGPDRSPGPRGRPGLGGPGRPVQAYLCARERKREREERTAAKTSSARQRVGQGALA